MNIEIIKSKRKTLEIQICKDLKVIVRAPYNMKKSDIELFLAKKQEWIEKHIAIMEKRQKELSKNRISLSDRDIRSLADEASKKLPIKVKYYADIIGVDYGRITIRMQKTRWGSCSSKGNLNFNCLLMLTPEEVQNYVVIHELCHRLEMNHSKSFWKLVENAMPDYRIYRAWLKENGSAIISSTNN